MARLPECMACKHRHSGPCFEGTCGCLLARWDPDQVQMLAKLARTRTPHGRLSMDGVPGCEDDFKGVPDCIVCGHRHGRKRPCGNFSCRCKGAVTKPEGYKESAERLDSSNRYRKAQLIREGRDEW